jgi:hypothetical protein
MYCAVMSSPRLGVSRPIIESSAMIPMRWATSAGVMVAAALAKGEAVCAARGEDPRRRTIRRRRMESAFPGQMGRLG